MGTELFEPHRPGCLFSPPLWLGCQTLLPEAPSLLGLPLAGCEKQGCYRDGGDLEK